MQILSISRLALLLFISAPLAAQTTEGISVSFDGNPANSWSAYPSISADGRFVAFQSQAANLVPDDTNSTFDVFVRDRQTGEAKRISVDSNGLQGNNGSYAPSISANGRFISFTSSASNLVTDDLNSHWDIFVHDLLTQETTLVSKSSLGGQANSACSNCLISANGRYVVFESYANSLVPGDTKGKLDIFLHDLDTATTTRISVDSFGNEAKDHSSGGSISGDGRYITFVSSAKNLVAGDTNDLRDVFVHDQFTGTTKRVNVDSAGNQSNNDSLWTSISLDGRFISFQSDASNLVPNDHNGTGDIFVHDFTSNETTRVSVNSLGLECNGYCGLPSISANGRFVSFGSSADNLVPMDTNGVDDCFLHDRLTGKTTRSSLRASGLEGNGVSGNASLTPDGRYQVFESSATNLVAGDSNGVSDIFVRDHGQRAATGTDSIVLNGPFYASILSPVQVSWFAAPPHSAYFLYYSTNRNGRKVFGHWFDLGSPAIQIASGINTSQGTGSYQSPPIPLSMFGQTIFVELVATDGSARLYDSIVQEISF